MDPTMWFDWDAICALAAMAPMWPPGTASGYHPVTIGYMAGEIFRRVDGRIMGDGLARGPSAGPFGLDLSGSACRTRAPPRRRPAAAERRLPNFGEINAPTKAGLPDRLVFAGGRGHQPEWRNGDPLANGHATAQALARLIGALANGGWLDGERILSPAMIAEAARERIRRPGPGAALRDELGRGLHAQPRHQGLGAGRADLRPLRMGRILCLPTRRRKLAAPMS
jgi:CubicO group peptidase (beta-lactamase class C family)